MGTVAKSSEGSGVGSHLGICWLGTSTHADSWKTLDSAPIPFLRGPRRMVFCSGSGSRGVMGRASTRCMKCGSARPTWTCTWELAGSTSRCDVGSRIDGSVEDLLLYPLPPSLHRERGAGVRGLGDCTLKYPVRWSREARLYLPRVPTSPRRLRRPATLCSCHEGTGCPVLVGAYIHGWLPCMGRPLICVPLDTS